MPSFLIWGWNIQLMRTTLHSQIWTRSKENIQGHGFKFSCDCTNLFFSSTIEIGAGKYQPSVALCQYWVNLAYSFPCTMRVYNYFQTNKVLYNAGKNILLKSRMRTCSATRKKQVIWGIFRVRLGSHPQ